VSTRNLFYGTVEANSLWVGPNPLDRTPLYKTSTDPNGVITAPGGALALDDTLGAVWLNVATLGAAGNIWTRLLASGYSAAGGDLSGLYPNPLVDGLQGRAVSAVAPAINESLTWNGAAWIPQAVGAGAITAVFGQFSHNTTENLVAGTTYTQDYTTVEDANGVSVTNDGLGNPTRLTVAAAGVYAFTISPQLLKGGGGQTSIAFWASLMGTAIPRSASIIDLPNNVQVLPFIELIVRMTAGQYVQWNFRTPGNGVSLINIPAAAPVPDAPSVIAGVKRLGA
jgi:hypothetical protein